MFLVVRPEVRRVRRDRRRPFTPDRLLTRGERRVGDPDRNGLGGVAGEVAQSDVADLVLDMPVPAPGGDRADTGVGAVGIDRQHQPLGQHLDWQHAAARDGTDLVEAAGAKNRFLEDVDQRHRAPSPLHLGLDPAQIARLRCRLIPGQHDRPGRPIGDVEPLQVRDRVVKLVQGGGHLATQITDEHARIQGLAQLPVVLPAALLEIDR